MREEGGHSGHQHSMMPPRQAPSNVRRAAKDPTDCGCVPSNLAVREELLDSPELAIKKNLEAFERKFDLQQALEDSLKGIVSHEGDRLLKVVMGGPHERIVDEVWSPPSEDARCIFSLTFLLSSFPPGYT